MPKKQIATMSGVAAGNWNHRRQFALVFRLKLATWFLLGRVNRLSLRCHRPDGDWLEVSFDENDTYHIMQKHFWRENKLAGLGPLNRIDRIRLAFRLEPTALTLGQTVTIKLYEDDELLLTCCAASTNQITQLFRTF